MPKNILLISKHSTSGLATEKVVKIQQTTPRNILVGKKPPTTLYFIIKQFQNPLIVVLLIAAGITALISHVTDTLVIMLAVFINTVLGFIQEKKAFTSLTALKKIVTHEAWVIRNSKKEKIAISDIVPGDVVVIFEGDKIPADGIIIEDNDLVIGEAILTGESSPVAKEKTKLKSKSVTINNLIDQINHNTSIKNINKAFMGTTVLSGSGKVLITKTGMKTEVGGIATHLDKNRERKTPLEKKLDILARNLTIIVVFLSIAIFTIGLITNRDPIEMFTTAVALAVAAIPEGLVVGLTVILAIGMKRILNRKGLVKTLVAAETLGSVTTVCVDKTGTLTEGKMKVVETNFINDILAYRASTLANDMRDPIEIARWQWAVETSRTNKKLLAPGELTTLEKRDSSIPFSVERRFLAIRHKNEIFLSGAPEEMMNRSTLNSKQIKTSMLQIEEWASLGRRLIGFGYIKAKTESDAVKYFKKLKDDKLSKDKIIWLGLMAFDDPIRKHVASSIQQAQLAGIDIKVITGDFSTTARAVMKKIGISINKDESIEGIQLAQMSDIELRKKVATIKLFTRTKPTQKLRILKALKDNGEIVGMMGDGVNDAPALSIADIGIVVEDATEVAKEASDLILLDSNMKTIIAAIEEGRSMFNNIRKVALYLLSDSFSEIFLVMFSLILGWPLTITAAQILWVNLVSDGLPNLALTVDPKDKNLLKRKPIDPNEKLITKRMRHLILMISIITATSGLVVFYYYWKTSGVVLARTMVFALLSIDSLLYVFSCRSLEKNIWEDSPFRNKYLVVSVLIGIIFTIASVHLAPLQKLLGTISLSLNQWMVIFIFSMIVIVSIEIFKWIYIKNPLRRWLQHE